MSLHDEIARLAVDIINEVLWLAVHVQIVFSANETSFRVIPEDTDRIDLAVLPAIAFYLQ